MWRNTHHSGLLILICVGESLAALSLPLQGLAADNVVAIYGKEKQVTGGPGGRILTNTGVWSPDSQWIIYDVRSDLAGDIFDGPRIEAVHVDSGEVQVLYTALNGANCGVATYHPRLPQVAFILGPENPTDDWRYAPNHRQGVVVDTGVPEVFKRLDARDLTLPFTRGALRGGTHVHVWDAAGDWLAYTYNDAIVEPGLRDIGIAVPGHRIKVNSDHPRNHDGEWFCALITSTIPAPRLGSDEIKRANEEGWIGSNGYVRKDGSRQLRAIAFQGQIATAEHGDVIEVFVVDLPDQLPAPSPAIKLSSSGRIEPLPGVHQRRLTHTTNRRYPGIQGIRHWLRSSPDGSRIAYLAKDDAGISQIWTVSPASGETKQLTNNTSDITSAFTWSPDGRWIAHGMAGHVCLTNTDSGATLPISEPADSKILDQSGSNACDPVQPADMRKEACVFSPDGTRIAFVRSMTTSTGATTNQICVIELQTGL